VGGSAAQLAPLVQNPPLERTRTHRPIPASRLGFSPPVAPGTPIAQKRARLACQPVQVGPGDPGAEKSIDMMESPMKLRTWLAGAATLLIATQGYAVIKTYTADADQSTLFPTDRRVYRGDCDLDAATPNAGDDQPGADDQCACTPGTNCKAGSVPNGECGGSEGRPNGGGCDPSLTTSLCTGGTNGNNPCAAESDCPGGGHCSGACPDSYASGPPWSARAPNNSDGIADLTHGSPEPSCNLTNGGSIVIDETGGVPTLVSMVLMAEFDDLVGASTITSIPGSTVVLHAENTLGPAPNQTGVGSTSGSINWGPLTGWSQTGRLFCGTTCPGGCGGASGCIPFVGFDGLGPPAPLMNTSFNTDPWVFTGDEFTSSTSFQIVSLGLDTVQAWTQLGGRQVAIPALPLAALGGLGAGLVYLGARALGRKRD
jgi:hypothetical protein